jgi:hypothetical protein
LLTKLLAKIKMLASTVQFSRNRRPPTTTRRLPHPHRPGRASSKQNGSSTVESPETAADSHSLRTQQRAKRPDLDHAVPSPPHPKASWRVLDTRRPGRQLIDVPPMSYPSRTDASTRDWTPRPPARRPAAPRCLDAP